jgi:hypothetical protein
MLEKRIEAIQPQINRFIREPTASTTNIRVKQLITKLLKTLFEYVTYNSLHIGQCSVDTAGAVGTQ